MLGEGHKWTWWSQWPVPLGEVLQGHRYLKKLPEDFAVNVIFSPATFLNDITAVLMS